jgi:hypothetical protein
MKLILKLILIMILFDHFNAKHYKLIRISKDKKQNEHIMSIYIDKKIIQSNVYTNSS